MMADFFDIFVEDLPTDAADSIKKAVAEVDAAQRDADKANRAAQSAFAKWRRDEITDAEESVACREAARCDTVLYHAKRKMNAAIVASRQSR